MKKFRVIGFFAMLLSFFIVVHNPASAATTPELLPTANGTYQQWSTHGGAIHYADVDEAVCNGTTDYLSETTVGQRESEKIDLSSIPDGSMITGISITPCASRNSNGGTDPIANVFYILNGVTSGNSANYTLPTGVTPVSLSPSSFTGLSTLKQSTTSLEIGMVYSAGNKGARLSRISTVVTYDPLSIPQNLTATASSYSSINLSWNDSTSETGYKIERSLDGSSNWTQVGTRSANLTTYVDSGLNALSTYYYRVYAYNSVANSGYSNVASATTPGTAPTVTTDSSQNITSSTADLYSTVNPHGDYTMAGFRYGVTNTSCNLLTGQTGYVSVTTGHVGVQSAMRAMNLDANTQYYYCAEAYNSYGTSYGIVKAFTTLTSLPVVTTQWSTNLSSNSARVYADVNAKGSSTTLLFRYGTTPTSCVSLPSSSSAQFVASDNTQYTKYQDISGLQPATPYYYCAVATNSQGSSYGAVNTFTTTSSQPSVTTTLGTSVGSTSAVLTSSVNPNGGATMVSYRYQQTNLNLSCNSLGSVTSWVDIGSGNTAVSPNNQTLDTLMPNTTYKFCAVAYNDGGTVYGNVQSFTTQAIMPTVTTSPSFTVISSSSAMIQGGENPNNSPTVMRFRYGTTAGSCASLPQTTPDVDFGTSVVMNRIEVLSGLSAATTYYYCASATNVAGTSYGDVYSFTTYP